MDEYTREQRAADLRKRLQVYREWYRERDCEALALRLQLNKAMSYLFQILDGSDRDGAISEARAWLTKFHKRRGGYALNSRLACESIPNVIRHMNETRNAQWPEEIEIAQ